MHELLLENRIVKEFDAKFQGEVGGVDFITYPELRIVAMMTDETVPPQSQVNGSWLKFLIDNKTIYISKLIVNSAITWHGLDERGLVFGETLAWIEGVGYKIRLIRGTSKDPNYLERGYGLEGNFASEWDRCFYQLIRNSEYIPDQFKNPNALYLQEDFMGMNDTAWETICMETSSLDQSNGMYRGYQDVAFSAMDIGKSRKQPYDGWRPVLELVEGSDQWSRLQDLEMEVQNDSVHFTISDWRYVDKVNVYRSMESIDPENLPPIHASVEQISTDLFTDTITPKETYYYYFEIIPQGDRFVLKPQTFVTLPYYPNSGPGSKYLVEQIVDGVGYFGEVSGEVFITPQAYLAQVGFTNGVPINQNTTWFKFLIDERVIFVAKRPIVHTVNFDQLSASNLVSGNKIITVKGRDFSCRLMRAVNDDYKNTTLTGGINDNNHPLTIGSEWNRLMYKVCASEPGDGRWEQYTQEQLGSNVAQSGQTSWCRETLKKTDNLTNCGRGYSNIGNLYARNKADGGNYVNWGYRPVLELTDVVK